MTSCQHTSRSILATISVSSLVLTSLRMKLPWEDIPRDRTWLTAIREAHVIIVSQVMSAARHGYKTIHIVYDDTDVYVLLVHFYKTLNIITGLLVVPTSYKPRNVANIGKLVTQ